MNDIVVPTTMIKIISKKINKNVGNKRINLPLMVNYPPNIINNKRENNYGNVRSLYVG